MLRKLTLLLGASILLASCSSNEGFTTKAPAQSGGPEVGLWQDTQGTSLSLADGNFTYRAPGQPEEMKGTYRVDGPQIYLNTPNGQSLTAKLTDPHGPLQVGNANLVKTD